MTIHYHGTPITPRAVLMTLAGGHFCVSHAKPQDVEICHQIGQTVLLDNGAFSKWKTGRETDWNAYYAWCDRWLDHPTTWAVIPDVIDAGTQEQDALIREWPHGQRGAPVWHMDEPIARLLRLTDEWPRVCIGSTDRYAKVGNHPWMSRMDEAFTAISLVHARVPWVHMLRGMQCVKWPFPFASVDSTDVGRNHNRASNKSARHMMDAWNAKQCPASYLPIPLQHEMEPVQ